MSATTRRRRGPLAFAAAVLLAFAPLAHPVATITIVNTNGPGVGFNDPTPVAPVGGNTGTTLGQQRLNAFAHAASLWGATLTSTVTIRVDASFVPLSCTATSAVLGGAAATSFFRDPSGTILSPANTFFPSALTDKLAGVDVNPADEDLFAVFNVNLGNPGCLTGSGFYLGLDNNHGPQIDLVAVLLHEFGHGLGFSVQPTSAATGVRNSGFPSRWEGFMVDNSTGLSWLSMTDAERAASAVNARRLVWTGSNVTASAPGVLSPGTPQLTVAGSSTAAGIYDVGAASFGPPLAAPGVTADIMPVVDQANGTGLACNPLNPPNMRAVSGRIALIDRGVCGFTVKVRNAQDAGAIGVIVADNVAGAPPPGLGGADPTITIPSVRVTLADCNRIKDALRFRSRTRSGVVGTLGIDPTRLAGADAFGRVLLFTPNPFQQGSSVSHWDTSAFRNLLMEPSINADLTHSVVPPQDLTFRLLQDMGW